jgi:hypothetical protein
MIGAETNGRGAGEWEEPLGEHPQHFLTVADPRVWHGCDT